MNKARKFLLPLISAIILGIVIWQVEPPESLTNARPDQIILFFIPLLLFLTAAFNLCFKFILKSLILSLGIISLLTLKAAGIFNPLSALAIILATLYLAKSLKKPLPVRSKSSSKNISANPKPIWLKVPTSQEPQHEKPKPTKPRLSRIKKQQPL